MKFQEIYEQFSMVSENDKDAMSNPLVRVFATVIIELSRAGLEVEERVRKLEAANADLKQQLKVADRAIIDKHHELKAALERY